MSWITESNQKEHFIYGIFCGFVGTLLFAAGVAVGMEYKDRAWGGKWDWLDILATVLGGLVGQVMQILFVCLLFWAYK